MSFKSLIVLLITTLAIAGCGTQKTTVKPSPSPKIVKETPTATPVPTPEPTPTATISAAPKASTKPQVKGTTTTRTVTTRNDASNALYDTSADSIDFTVFGGQDQSTTITLYNKSNAKVLYAVRANGTYSETYPIKLNGSNEATGEIGAFSTATFNVSTVSSNNNPNFTGSIQVNFVSTNDQVLATRNITVATHTPKDDVIELSTNTDADQTGNASMSIAYKSNYAYPIRLVNRHSRKINWSGKVVVGGDKMKLSAATGTMEVGQTWLTTLQFTSADIGSLRQAKVEFYFHDDNHEWNETKTVTVDINK